MSIAIRSSRSLAHAAAGLSLAVSMVIAALVVGPVGVGAQTATPPTPFPRPLVAFVPAPASGPTDPALAIQTVAAGEGSGVGSGGTRRVTVGFASSFTLPTESYRVSVVWGNPGGPQTRASMVSSAGTTSGVVETSTDGRSWTDAGATTATFGDDSVAIDASLGEASDGAGLWVQAQLGKTTTRLVTTPVFSLDAALGRTSDGGLSATSWGSPDVAAGTEATNSAPVAFGTAAPTLSVDNKSLIVDDPAPAPTKLDGQAVTGVVDEVTFLPGYTPSGTVSGVVQINRTAGTIRALSGATGLPEDRTGGGSWIATGIAAPPASFAAPVTVTLDLQGVTTALGIPLDPNGTGLGLRRKVTLADGTVVVGLPVTATVGWFQTAAVPSEAPPGTLAPEVASTSETASGTSTSIVPLLAAAAVAAVLVVVAVAFLLMARRRRRLATVQADLFGEDGVGTRSGVPDPVREPAPDAAPDASPMAEPEPGRSPAEVLAALDAEVEGLSARVERLGLAEEAVPPRPGGAER
jgi:hypothetical protein